MILVVDDDRLLRSLFELVLRQRGHDVVTAATLAEAHEACERTRPDVVTVDMMMPQGSGVDLIRELRASSPATRIIAISGNPDLLTTAIDAGADIVLAKPFAATRLVEAVEGLLVLVKR